jgi:atypical dual specificity phosphatase
MDNFLHDPQSQGRVVVVHCTHGLNRTGYLVARYLVVRRGYQPADAISGLVISSEVLTLYFFTFLLLFLTDVVVFNKARGYPIERENYIENLNQMIQEVCPHPIPLFQERYS